MKTSCSVSHFLFRALPLSIAALLAGRFLARSSNKTYAEIALVATAFAIITAVYFMMQKINRVSRLQAELLVREEYLRETLHSLDEGVITTDMNGLIQQMNLSAERLSGWESRDANGRPLEMVYDVVNEETGKPVKHIVKRILEQGERVEFENNTLLRRRTGEQIVISNNGVPIRDGRGNIVGAVLVFRDITASTKAQAELKKRKQQLRSILDALPANIALLDKDGGIVEVNASWIRFAQRNNLGNPQSFIGHNYIEVAANGTGQDAETGKQMAEGIKEVIRGEVFSFELEYPCHSPSEERWFKAEVAPLLKEQGSGAVVMHIDISERKLAEKAILELNEHLENRVKDRTEDLESFTYSVSHDLRAPLRLINGFAKILKETHHNKLDADGEYLLSTIQSSAKGMAQLIEDLLKLSRSEKAELLASPTDMKAMVEDVVSDIKLSNKNAAVKIILKDLPVANCDAGLMKQVWINLVSNGVKYSSKSLDPAVEIGCTQLDESNIYYVKDNGVGFDMESEHRLFRVFQRLHSSEEFEGTGIGLNIAQRIIHKHGGKIWAEAKLGEGATFYFSIPKA